MEADEFNFQYKAAVKDKVGEIESRLASLGKSSDSEKGVTSRRSSQKGKHQDSENVESIDNAVLKHHKEVTNVSPVTSGRTSPEVRIPVREAQILITNHAKHANHYGTSDNGSHLNKHSKPQVQTKSAHSQNDTSNKGSNIGSDKCSAVIMAGKGDPEKCEQNTPKIPIPAPRRIIQVTPNAIQENPGNYSNDSNSTRPPSSASSTRRSSEDDGIADMALESDPFDESTMPLPKIKENAFLLKDRRQQNTVTGADNVASTPISPLMNLRRGSLNPQSGPRTDESEKPKPHRTRTDSTNSAENFVVRQISADTDTSRRESQAEIKIDVIQSKGCTQNDSGVRSPVIIRSKTLCNTVASILVLGLPQSGKSKTIEALVQKPVTGQETPGSAPEIVEYSAKIKILDSSNLFTLKIIETPGYSNDPTISADAQLMSTLLSYLESKDGLRGKSPTIVLVVLRFDDNRLWNPEDEHPDIVNFLKLIHNFQQHLNDNKYANFVFVLTHCMSENIPEREQKRPESKIVELINLIQKYTSLPLPIMVVCAENEPTQKKARALKQQTDKSPDTPTPMSVALPNGNTYPYNLIDKIKILLTKKGRDSVGETVLRTAFGIEYPYSIKECSITLKIPLIPAPNLSVQKIQKAILHAYKDIQRTEIFTLLEIGWENIDLKIREKYPESLFAVQQIFQTKKVCNFTDIPEDTDKVLNLVRQMPSNLAVKDLLIDTLQLKVPACYPALYIGQGFDLSKDTTTNVSPFQLTTGLKTSPVGLIPNEYECKIRDDREICFKFFEEMEEYVSERLKDMNLRYSVSQNSLSALSAAATSSAAGQRWGYNLVRKNHEPTKTTLATAVVEYRIFQITLHQQPELQFKPQFWEAVTDIPDLDINDPSSLEKWREFFGYWGTHVVKQAFGGGSVEITFRGSVLSKIYNSMKKDFILPSDEYDTTRVFQWITGDGLDFVASCGKDIKNDFLQGHDVQAHFHGGDIKYQQIDLTKLGTKEEVANIREDWKESLGINPVMLETNLVLVPLSHFIRSKSEGIATKIDVALHYFYSDFMVNQGKGSSCTIL